MTYPCCGHCERDCWNRTTKHCVPCRLCTGPYIPKPKEVSR